MSFSRVGIVTGANKGIGLAIVRQLALQYPQSKLNSGSLLIYLTARDKSRGDAAVDELRQDEQLQKAKALTAQGGLADIKFHQLDIVDADSIRKLRDRVKRDHPDGIDFLINNASIAMVGFDSHIVETTLRCNYYGAVEMDDAFIPLIKLSGRIVNVASGAEMLIKMYSPAIQQRFRGAETVDDVTAIMEDFKTAVADGKEKEEGWASAAYATSKIGQVAMTRALAKDKRVKDRSLVVNSCNPGVTQTDMTRGRGWHDCRTPDEGALGPVMLAIGDIGEANGTYWSYEKEKEW